jgi:hypothetical protein
MTRKRQFLMRRQAAIFAGLALTASFGLAGAGTASAAAPALHVHNGASWTIEVKGAGCEAEVFHSNGTFASPDGDAGTWSGGGSTINMVWTAGAISGLKFSGHFVSTTHPVEYKGSLSGLRTGRANLVKGAVAGC